MELYEYARPSLMSGKKVLYLHGFASSGSSGTVRIIRMLLPEAEVIAPDIPVDPHEAVTLLRSIAADENPDLVIGSSMGGMYAELLHGIDRILVNPAFQLADTILKNNGLGKREFRSPRADGQKDFLVTKALLEAFRDVSSQCFTDMDDDERRHVFALFGTRDTLVHTHDLTRQHYPQCISFDGEHSLNDATFLHSVLPVIQWIDDRQNGVEHPSVLIAFDDVLRYAHNGETVASAVKAVEHLSEHYSLQFVVDGEHDGWDTMLQKRKWLEDNIGVPCWNRVTLTTHKELLLGDFLIDAHPDVCGGDGFMGTTVEFGSDTFKDWNEVVTFFDRLNPA
ncbi:MAG: YqiA/YcfP family alpha/beta fold hydrolase [Bacteroidia bacterium]|nr:YqiA/YcfP family alpha/beta fold hydrolase [Bacteroidia bacterium]